MPRKRTHSKSTNWNKNDRRKFRIGNRKGGTSALDMTTKDLLDVLSNPDKKKYHSKAVAVLKHRGNLNQ